MGGNELWITLEGASGPGQGRHVVLISGDEEYRSEQALPMLAQILSRHHGFRCTTLFAIDPRTGLVNPNILTNCPGLHQLETADMVVLFVRFREWPDADMKRFIDYVFAGKALLGIRTSTHAFWYQKNRQSPYAKFSSDNKGEYLGGFGRQVLGEKWSGHHGRHRVESTLAVPRATMVDHPILRGVGRAWGPSDVYVAQPPGDARVLMDGHVLEGMNSDDPARPWTPTMPIAWIREPDVTRGTGRVMCSTMGAATDLRDASLRRLLVNGVYWGAGIEDQIAADSCVDPVGQYAPTDYGTIKDWVGKPARSYFVA